MKTFYKNIAVLLLLLSGLSSCKKDLATATLGTPANITLTSNLAAPAAVTLTSADSSASALKLTWTKVNFLTDTLQGNVSLKYELQVDTTAAFKKPVKNDFITQRDTAFTQYALNSIVTSLGCKAGVSNNVFVRVVCVTSRDSIKSNVFELKVTPYSTLLPLKIQMPVGGLYVLGNATAGGWDYSKITAMTKINYHTYQVTLPLAASQTYDVIGNATGNPWIAYTLTGGVNASSFVTGGAFIESSAATNWPATTDLLSPPTAGTYTLTFDFVTATYTVSQ